MHSVTLVSNMSLLQLMVPCHTLFHYFPRSYSCVCHLFLWKMRVEWNIRFWLRDAPEIYCSGVFALSLKLRFQQVQTLTPSVFAPTYNCICVVTKKTRLRSQNASYLFNHKIHINAPASVHNCCINNFQFYCQILHLARLIHYYLSFDSECCILVLCFLQTFNTL